MRDAPQTHQGRVENDGTGQIVVDSMFAAGYRL